MVKVYACYINDLPDPQLDKTVLKDLPQNRIEKILKQHKIESRKQSLGAGLLLKYVLSKYGTDSSYIKTGTNGKPEVQGLHFNISHSNDIVICAVSENDIGCDIEKISTANLSIAKRFFTENEFKYIESFSGKDADNEFYRLWTAKESFIKMTGEGLSRPLKSFEVQCIPKMQIIINEELYPCYIKEYQIEGYKLTVCAKEDFFENEIEVLSPNKLFQTE